MDFTEEKSILERFKTNYDSFPTGEIDQPDKPDFIVHGSKKIGIELTQIFQDQESSKGSFLRSIEEYKRKTLNVLIELLNTSELNNSVVSLDLNNEHLDKSINPKTIAEECFKDIVSKFRDKQYENHTTYTIENVNHLPNSIESYNIWFDSNLSNAEYVVTTGAVGKPITNKVLQFVLDKKEIALKNFAPCDSYWLIIKEGSFGSDYFPQIKVEPKSLKTSFDKIFILRQFSPLIVEII